ncbi:MAG: nucleotidyl transferase AbiEii/AbiGii toxin family protein [Candidatus Moranbacteria bacterium]|nr:nucleotidyl transferase AbiEii/AbiGii toxin family protein [Candidatus Moranbacteria bacterium]
MDIASGKQIDSNLTILPLATKKAFIFLSEQSWLSKSNWYLAGGTALALQAGNRKSVDLDFFTTEKDFNNQGLLNNFSENSGWTTAVNKKNTIYGELFKAKVSFIAYPFFIPKQDFIQFGSINILRPLDIAAMKIIAISQRGRKRDFFDLYWCAKNIEPLENLVKRLKEQYPFVAHDYHHILKSLVYFKDAESDPAPDIFFKADWKEVKDYFKIEVLRITRKIILE